ncbi:MAG: DedA family protein [Pseudomonadota bacterium]|nr:DedA family protein [Pseudomonadota bacterium]
MSFELIIARYGLIAVCLGAGIEGETAVMAGGVLAHQHLVTLPSVTIAAAAGSFVADQGFFSAGRHFRDRPYVQKILDKPAAHRAISLLERYPNGFILAIRFLYGIRTLSPIAVGASEIARTRFMVLNGIAAVFWAILFTAIGYELGDGLKSVWRHINPVGTVLLGAFIVAAVAFLAFRMSCRHFHHRTALRWLDRVRAKA